MTYRFDRLSLRGFLISTEYVESTDDEDAVSDALHRLASTPIGHVKIFRDDRVVWSSRREDAQAI